MTEKMTDFVCVVRKISHFFAGKGYWGKPISIPRARRGWCVWCPSEGCRTFSTASGAVAKRKWSNSPVFCGKVVLCSILGYKLLKSLSPKGKNGTAKLGFSGEERSSFLHFPVVEKSILFSGEKDDFSAVPVAVWPSTFSGQRPGRAGTVPARYWSCPA